MDLRPGGFVLVILASGPVLAGVDDPTDMGPVNRRIEALIKTAASDTAQSWIKRVPGEVIDARPALGGAFDRCRLGITVGRVEPVPQWPCGAAPVAPCPVMFRPRRSITWSSGPH